MVRIAGIQNQSIAEELELQIGSRIVRINGKPVRDVIDYRFLEAEALLELEVHAPGADAVLYEIEKDAGEPLGLTLTPDTVRQCANKCVFCFIDGNPAGARKSLHLKDDDFRLSFTYGSYVTLTNLGPRGFERLIEQRLSPLYVSVHATEPAVRERLLGVPLGGNIVEQLKELTDAGLQIHTQIVLCPGWNDGSHLDRTIDDLWALGENVLSLSVVPVGLTRYNLNRPVRLLEPAEAAAAIAQVDQARERAKHERGLGWAYVGDEMFFIAAAATPLDDHFAGAELPLDDYYDDWPLTENGVGAVRRLIDEFNDGLASVPALHGQRVVILTGKRMEPVLQPLAARLAERSGAQVTVIGVTNTYFGDTVTTAGLLAGADIVEALETAGDFDLALLPAEALNDDARFIDDVSFESVRARFSPAAVHAAFELTSALRAITAVKQPAAT
jgi:putative radical SAM enzyme (TIGR03279 family)